ncbi:histidine phosphatase family protein [Sphingomonas sp. ID1715]|uniref:histidine phosphatase family protein n=1 Tax=Sphingomonas sp. ID1715 TaxID=1656898 RepID=UPI001487DF93|nr:histidine phosphatase family protein [Sphingomonas sp. ID1715]NNM76015.1 histidine phosphatase family protein [Sphingomonas sp. ID1715]
MASRWPSILWLVRHGQSAGNVARDAAHEQGLVRITLTGRDVDVPLSPLGEDQARALGAWFAAGGDQPDVLLSSSYVRAQQTAALFRDAGGCAADIPICVDERLREKEFGILDGLTTPGVAATYPDQAEFRRILGKFYHRPPGGESWADVILRLRSLLDTVSLHHAEQRVMIVAHQVVVLCLRYVIESLSEAEILAIDAEADVANCSVTEYRLDPREGAFGKLVLSRYNVTAPMEEAGAAVTSAPEPIQAVRG